MLHLRRMSEANQFLFEIGNFFCVPVTFGLGFFCRIAEMKTFCDTFGYAGRFQALINSVHAVIALDGFSGLRVPLGSSPWTGCNAGFTADAKCLVDEDDAVLGSFCIAPVGQAATHQGSWQ